VAARTPSRRRLPRAAAAVLALLLALGTVAGTSTAPAEASPGAFVAAINGTRASRGLAPLQVSGELSAKAQSWAQHMASVGQISHSGDLSSGVSANWTKLGENVGVGGTVSALHAAFVASPSHLRNIVDPAYTHIGVGVVHAGGVMYTAHVFMAVAGGGGGSAPAPPSASTPSRSTGPRQSGGGGGGGSESGSSSGGGGSGNDNDAPSGPLLPRHRLRPRRSWTPSRPSPPT
jgi:hypothetical protein